MLHRLRCHSLPDFIALIGPSDSLFSFSRKLWSSLALGLPRDECRVSLRGSLARLALQTHPFVRIARGDGFYRLPVWPGHTRGRRQGLPGFWIVLFTRAAANDSAGCMSLSPFFASAMPWPSRRDTLWAPGIITISWLARRGSSCRMPTHQRGRYRPRCKTCYRPDWAPS